MISSMLVYFTDFLSLFHFETRDFSDEKSCESINACKIIRPYYSFICPLSSERSNIHIKIWFAALGKS